MNVVNMRPPVSEPIAVLSDIHGQLTALDAVVDAVRHRGVSRIYVAGDLLTDGPEPLGVWRRLQELDAKCTRGLSDSALCTIDPSSLKPSTDEEREKAEAFLQTRNAVGELVLAALRKLPLSLRLPMLDGSEMVMAHGTPSDPYTELTQEMDDEELARLVDDDPADIVAVGASHVPFQRVLEEVHVINVGSVGAAPEGNVSHFTVITPAYGGATIEQDWLEY